MDSYSNEQKIKATCYIHIAGCSNMKPSYNYTQAAYLHIKHMFPLSLFQMLYIAMGWSEKKQK